MARPQRRRRLGNEDLRASAAPAQPPTGTTRDLHRPRDEAGRCHSVSSKSIDTTTPKQEPARPGGGAFGYLRQKSASSMIGLFGAGLLGTTILRPVFIYLANAEGAGKTLLAKCAISPTHGLVKTDGDLKDKAETAKELLAAVIETRPYILFDNCKRHLDSSYLEAFVTSVIWSGRILGLTNMFAGDKLV